MSQKCLLHAACILLAAVSSTLAKESNQWDLEEVGTITLRLKFLPQLDDKGQPFIIDGGTVIRYIPAGHEMNRRKQLQFRTDLVIQSFPTTPNHDFGRLFSLRNDVQILTNDRIITDKNGAFHATLRTWNEHADWDIKIYRWHHSRTVKSERLVKVP